MVLQQDWTNFSLQRPNYFAGQYLQDEDFELAHKYLSDRQRYINSKLHLAGIVEGLEVEAIAGKAEVTIKAGTAIDGEGNLIILTEATSREIKNEFWLCLRYRQELKVLQQPEIPYSFTRVAETPLLALELIETKDSKTVILAKLTPENGEVKINTKVRQYSGVRLPNGKNNAIALQSDGDALVIKGNLDLAGNLNLGGTLNLAGNLNLAGTLQLSDRSSLSAVSEIIDAERDRATVIPSEKAVKDHIENRLREERRRNLTIFSLPTEPIVITGMIVMWSGSITNIPSGWALCDGTNDTPNLKDRFVVGAGGLYNLGDKGGSAEVTLTLDQIPSHNHAAANFKQLLQKTGSNTYHGISDNNATEPDLLHAAEILPAGGGMAHENTPPYFALAYIIKL